MDIFWNHTLAHNYNVEITSVCKAGLMIYESLLLGKQNRPLSMGVCIKQLSVEQGSTVHIIVIFMCIQFLSDKQVVNCKFNSI